MGIGTIMSARKILIIISGEDKAALSKLDIKKTTGRICSNDSAGGFSKIS